ncbi:MULTISPECIES: nucleotidyl transferase AbiEii/AbiGii toxin family protein [unclassified Neptuniibacter]|uniref:nucleotidyl transferase AbiEii/AbiGii toxin family protein n=1 Tax=unclassified Neptuniibacter TaxID=2630693 RepID=UPI000C64909F|nr:MULTISPECIES: nucleotidyl transferase AbiEii/AbiGii toxin family protein [unclassified Neptuniibacter]MAY42514.1 hypothetical protein [Oceanospirillaceae bacterium]|tara:strand:+ start:23242 stop:23928 length:687 start_codon:yes stop_codon:yes gene_type:complete
MTLPLLDVIKEFSPLQKQHVEVMARIAQKFSDSPMILKGGTALMLCHGLDRYSEDLDFDSTVPINPESRMKDAFHGISINLESIKKTKDTQTTKRWMLEYSGPEGKGRLKFEVSYRASQIDEQAYTTINDIKVYHAQELISQKLNAAENRSKIRDLFDLGYLAREFADLFTPDQVSTLNTMVSDLDSLQSRYVADHIEDSILKDIDLEDLVLELGQSAEELNGLTTTS